MRRDQSDRRQNEAPSARVLIVEDELEEAKSLLDTIEADLGEAEATPSTDRALELLDDRSFDCVVQAFDLPDEHGIELVRRLREGGHDLPIVLRSERDVAALEENALAAGADVFLRKGEDEDRVRETVEDLIARGSSSSSASASDQPA